MDVAYSRDGKQADTKVFVMAETVTPRAAAVRRRVGRPAPPGVEEPTYKLAIIGVEYPDVKHNAKIKDADWEESMFSLGTYTGKTATGQTGLRQHERLLQGAELRHVQGRGEVRRLGRGVEEADRTTPPAAAPSTQREDGAADRGAGQLHAEEDGKDALKDYDGVFFLYAGGPGEHDPRRAVLAAPGERQLRRPVAPVLHRAGGRRRG